MSHYGRVLVVIEFSTLLSMIPMQGNLLVVTELVVYSSHPQGDRVSEVLLIYSNSNYLHVHLKVDEKER